MAAAVALPGLDHPRATGQIIPGQPPPTAEERSAALRNYTQVLGYLAQHGAWDHFSTVLVRGVAVSEAADQDVE